MKITAHVLVKNEDRFIWYSLMSIIKYVDRIRVWDTGSSDNTVKIIEEVAKTKEGRSKEIFDFKKVKLSEFSESRARQRLLQIEKLTFSDVRQKMLDQTTADWFFVVDGDEVWWEESIKTVVEKIRQSESKYDSLVVPSINLVGDMFHYQEEKAGRYHLAGKVGHYNLRAIRRSILGLHAQGEHGVFGWVDASHKMVEDRDPERILFSNSPYLHMTHLRRSDGLGADESVFKRSKKLKHEIGIKFPKDFYFPEVFFRPRPSIVPSVWEIPDFAFWARSFFETPLRYIYRRTLLPFKKHGY